MEGVVNKKYLRIPDFLFQSPPANYITAVGRNALGLNKKKLTIDDIRNLKSKRQKRKAEADASKNQSKQSINEDDVFSLMKKKRESPVLAEETPKEKLVKKSTQFENIDWLNIPEAKKMTTRYDSNEQTETINKFNTLDKLVKKGSGSDLMTFTSNNDWKEEITALLTKKTDSSDILKVFNRSLKYALKGYELESLKFHLQSINNHSDKLLNDALALETILSHVYSILRYSNDDEILLLSYKTLKRLNLNSRQMVSFLKTCISRKSDNYKSVGWCLRQLYLIESEDLSDDIVAKKVLLSEYLHKYGDDVIELLYESVLVDFENKDNVQELIGKLPLVEWERFLNEEIYVGEECEVDEFFKYVAEIIIEKRYNKNNVNNFKNITNKFSSKHLKQYIEEQILKSDQSTSIWEFYFNQVLAKNDTVDNLITLLNYVLNENGDSSNETMALIDLFIEKFCYNGNKNSFEKARDFVAKNSGYDKKMIYHQLKIQRIANDAHEKSLETFENLKNSEHKFMSLKFCLEYFEWIAALDIHMEQPELESLYVSYIGYFKKDPCITILKCKYYKWLITNNQTEKCCALVSKDLESNFIDTELFDVLIFCMNKQNSEILFNKWTLFLKDILIKHPSKKITISMMLEKLLYRKILFDQENPMNIKFINEFLSQNKIDHDLIKEHCNLGLIISLRLKLELRALKAVHGRNYNAGVKNLIKRYLADYDNNYLILYQISFELKDCKWLMNSIKKNPSFKSPYDDLLSGFDKVKSFKGYKEFKDALTSSNMKSIYCPNVEFIEFSGEYQ